MKKGRLIIFMGETGSGKTIDIIQTVKEKIEEGENVLYFSNKHPATLSNNEGSYIFITEYPYLKDAIVNIDNNKKDFNTFVVDYSTDYNEFTKENLQTLERITIEESVDILISVNGKAKANEENCLLYDYADIVVNSSKTRTTSVDLMNKEIFNIKDLL